MDDVITTIAKLAEHSGISKSKVCELCVYQINSVHTSLRIPLLVSLRCSSSLCSVHASFPTLITLHIQSHFALKPEMRTTSVVLSASFSTRNVQRTPTSPHLRPSIARRASQIEIPSRMKGAPPVRPGSIYGGEAVGGGQMRRQFTLPHISIKGKEKHGKKIQLSAPSHVNFRKTTLTRSLSYPKKLDFIVLPPFSPRMTL